MRTRERDVEPFVNLSELTEIELLILRRFREYTLGEHRSLFHGAGFDYVAYKGPFADIVLGAEYQHFDLERKQAVSCGPATSCPGVPHQGFLHDANGDIVRVRLSLKSHGWGIH